MLPAERRRTELPNDCAGLAIGNGDRGDRPKAHDNVAVWQLGESVPVAPYVARLLDRGQPIGLRIEMLPQAVFPEQPPIGGHLDQNVAIHVAVVFGAGHASLYS